MVGGERLRVPEPDEEWSWCLSAGDHKACAWGAGCIPGADRSGEVNLANQNGALPVPRGRAQAFSQGQNACLVLEAQGRLLEAEVPRVQFNLEGSGRCKLHQLHLFTISGGTSQCQT